MSDSRTRTMLECGFSPPIVAFKKNDPRGSEYGYFQASICSEDKDDRRIRVVKQSDTDMVVWACIFDDQISFANWAKDYT